MQARGTVTTDLNDRKVALRLPKDRGYEFKVPSDSVRFLGKGGSRFDQIWKVKAPVEAHNDIVDFFVVASGITDEPVKEQKSISLQIQQTVDKADLVIDIFRVASSSQVGEVIVLAVGQRVILQARVKNNGTAKVIGTGELKLDLGLTGLEFINPVDSVKAFTVGDLVEWEVQAPDKPVTVSRIISVNIHFYPLDENTNTKSESSISEQTLTVRTSSIGTVRVDSLYIASPLGARDGTVSTDQYFGVKAVISSERVKDPIQARIGFSSDDFSTASSTQNVTVEDSVEVFWEVKAPREKSVDFYRIWVTVTAEDENWEDYAITPASDTIKVRTEEKTTFSIKAGVTDPEWIEDRVSTGQKRFEIAAWVEHKGAPYVVSDSFTIKMAKPANYSFYETYEKTTTDTARWYFDAPEVPSTEADIFSFELIKVPSDSNSGKVGYIEAGGGAKDIKIYTVNKASLSLNALVTDPDPPSTTIWIGRQFEVTTQLINNGTANTKGQYKVGIELPEHFKLINSADSVKISTESEISWSVQAPKIITNRTDTLCFKLLEYPQDQYSGELAEVTNDSAHVVIVLDHGRLAVSSFSLRNRTAVTRGGQNIPVLGLRMESMGAGTTDTVHVHKLSFVIKDNNNEPIAPNRALSRITIVDHSTSQVLTELSESELPIKNPIQFFSEINPLKISGHKPDSIRVEVNIPRSTTETGFRVTLDSSAAVRAYDPASDSQVSIANAQGDDLTILGIESDYLVLISDDFSESFCNYPNPFGTPTTTPTKFVYNLREDSDIKLMIFTLTGDLVLSKSYTDSDIPGQAGLHDGDITWDGRNGKGYRVLNGVYLAYLTVKKTNETAMAKIAVVR